MCTLYFSAPPLVGDRRDDDEPVSPVPKPSTPRRACKRSSFECVVVNVHSPFFHPPIPLSIYFSVPESTLGPNEKRVFELRVDFSLLILRSDLKIKKLHPLGVSHIVGFPAALEVEHIMPKPQGRIRRDSLQVSTIYFLKGSHPRKNLRLIFCLILFARAIKWRATLQDIV